MRFDRRSGRGLVVTFGFYFVLKKIISKSQCNIQWIPRTKNWNVEKRLWLLSTDRSFVSVQRSDYSTSATCKMQKLLRMLITLACRPCQYSLNMSWARKIKLNTNNAFRSLNETRNQLQFHLANFPWNLQRSSFAEETIRPKKNTTKIKFFARTKKRNSVVSSIKKLI